MYRNHEELLAEAYTKVVKAIKDEYKDDKTRNDVVDALVEQLKFNIKGTKADLADKPFDWAGFNYNDEKSVVYDDFIINNIFGNILMDYTNKAAYEDIIELDEYLVDKFEKVWLR